MAHYIKAWWKSPPFAQKRLFLSIYPPIITVGAPNTIEPPWAVVSPILAAGIPPIITVAEPLTMESGGPTQTQESPTLAAGIPAISTFGCPGPTIGPPT